MRENIDAIYERGVFRPLKHPAIPDGQHVRLLVEALEEATTEDMLELAAQVYDGLSPQQIDEIEEIAIDRRDFFGDKIS
ncbi:MAG: hypothetical protein AUK24_05465 [Syntrophaceae bacterium CG2_30_49_12]|nr:MAG: hypothetical protein AUK24_05465 [Syntrophaceae bacterium CG2_30_49_12]PJC76253.1 MAG: hypothetical protein CO012_01530 [Syntrophobacterales bacterium CG_4_8_14_3_um_filter_49_14]